VEIATRRPGATRDSSLTALEYSTVLRNALLRSHALLRERDLGRLRRLVLRDSLELLEASAARFHALDQDGRWQIVARLRDEEVPPPAERMEQELLPRAVAAGKSLISTHRRLDPDLSDLARYCRGAGVTTHVLLLRAHQETCGALGIHWIDRPRPVEYERRSVFLAYWDNAGLAVAAALEGQRLEAELAALRQRAYRDPLTGLPNQQALEEELQRQADTWPLGVLALDFDGMREANTVFGSYADGGDVLIRAVGEALAALAGPHELPARLHTAGDEFALVLPGLDEPMTRQRAAEIERELDNLPVPRTHRDVYHGASVGYAQRRDGETAGQTLGRAIEAMRERKLDRKATLAAEAPATLPVGTHRG
jgi:diguanylate cyclase (GGDEF)-like protein